MTDAFIPLEDCSLFPMQDEAYEAFGLSSWTQKGVPFSLTNSISLAKRYASFIEARLLNSKKKISILELGAGSGKLCFLIMTLLEQKLCLDELQRIEFYLTDKAHSVVNHYGQNKQLKHFIELGVVKTKLFDALNDDVSDLDLQSEPFIIAHYFFDTIEQKLYAKKKGVLFKGRIRLDFKGQGSDRLATVKESYDFVKTNDRLDLYKNIDDALILWPSGAFRVLERLEKQLSGFCLLIADKGDHTLEHIVKRIDPSLNKHATFSFPVNFHALRDFANQKGWHYIDCQPDKEFSVVSIQKGSMFHETIAPSDLLVKNSLELDPHALCSDSASFIQKLGAKKFKECVQKALERLFILDENDIFVRDQLKKWLNTSVIEYGQDFDLPAVQIGDELLLFFKTGKNLEIINLNKTPCEQKYKTLFYIDLSQITLEDKTMKEIDSKIDHFSDEDLEECIKGVAQMQLVKPSLITSFFYDLLASEKINQRQYQETINFFHQKGMISNEDKQIKPLEKKSRLSEKMLRDLLQNRLEDGGMLIVYLRKSKEALNLAEIFMLDYRLCVSQKIISLDDKKILQLKIKLLY